MQKALDGVKRSAQHEFDSHTVHAKNVSSERRNGLVNDVRVQCQGIGTPCACRSLDLDSLDISTRICAINSSIASLH